MGIVDMPLIAPSEWFDMRIYFNRADRPKNAAKLLARSARKKKLADIQAAIAKACGYIDWYDLDVAIKHCRRSSDAESLDHARDVIVAVAAEVGADIGDVQYALVQSRLLFVHGLSLENELRLRAKLWRKCLFGTSARGKSGTVVTVNAPGVKHPAYLRSFGGPAHLLYDTGFGMCADFEVVTPRLPLEDFVPSRLWLPYGYWTLTDGTIATFARDYKPLWRIADGLVSGLSPGLRSKTSSAQRTSRRWPVPLLGPRGGPVS